ncbi:glycosyltransferase family 4 protein [Rhizobium sp. G187]|uniref:glycosyltransferase family 4 protein n=1 Tax=unclassified Rhizobium TaxID=2613769 RepID=UPI0006B93E76|nr:glycosyltransferase family 4 protein [Rhizobium sp. AAP43]KPF44597.1 glycosyl transferase [Rhizobium sp. AAP43]
MTRSLVFAYPGDLTLKTGGYGYDRAVVAGLKSLGWDVQLLALGDGFPAPSTDTRRDAEARLSALSDGALVLIDGLAFGVLDDWAMRERSRLKIVALVHHPLALETGLSPTDQERLTNSERRALSATRHVIVTSQMTAREVADRFEIAAERITTAIPGTARGLPSTASGQPPHIVSIGTLTRRKGHDVLVSALKKIEDLDWTASIIGSRRLDPEISRQIEAQIATLGLADRIALCGEVDDTATALAGADIFALASRYEGYGMVFAEALTQGLPIVACHAGAVPEVVPADAGILVPVDDPSAFAAALRRLLTDEPGRAARAEASARAGSALPRWDDTSRTISNALETVR